MPMVKCNDCGLLCMEDPQTCEIRRADRYARDEGLTKQKDRRIKVVRFCCKVGAKNFQDLKVPFSRNPADMRGYAPVDRDEIDCEQFVAWIEAKTPKEHEEMSILETVKAENAAAHGRQEALNESRHQEIRSDVRRRDKLIVVSTSLSAISVVIAILVAVFK